jgi:hypothetical protein
MTAPSEAGMRAYLAGLRVAELRAMAVDARYRWELRRGELIDFLVAYQPRTVAEAMAAQRDAPAAG